MKVLFCCDGSSQAVTAVRFGVLIVSACGAEPSILGIADNPGAEHVLRKALGRVQGIFKEHDLDAELIIKVGRLSSGIVKHTSEVHYDLVVIGAAPKNVLQRFLDPTCMSVRAYNIIEAIEPPVLVVIGGRPALRRILLCTGGAEYIEKAITFTGKIAQAANALVDLVHVMPETPALYADLVQFEGDVDRVLESKSKLGQILRHQKVLLEQFGVFGEIRLRQGQVVPELLKELKRTDYDLVVSGSLPPEERLRKYVMGNIARELLCSAEVPVLIIRTGPQKHIIHRFMEFLANLVKGSKKTSGTSNS